MVEEGGKVEDVFQTLVRKKLLTSFSTANYRAGRSRSNSKVYDDFALVEASQAEFAENQSVTPQYTEEVASAEASRDEELTPTNTPQPASALLAPYPQSRPNPIITPTYRTDTILADKPPQPAAAPNTARGRKKLLRVPILSAAAAPRQKVTVD